MNQVKAGAALNYVIIGLNNLTECGENMNSDIITQNT